MTTSKTRHDQIKAIIREVSRRHGVEASAILGVRKSRAIAYARMEAMYRVRREVIPKLSLPHIGLVFGRDHSTVHTSLEKVGRCVAKSGEWPVINDSVDPDFDPGAFTLRALPEPAPKPQRPREIIVTRPCTAVRLSRRINAYWAARDIEANARAVMVGGRIIVKSDLRVAV